jgi:hypothetical protein
MTVSYDIGLEMGSRDHITAPMRKNNSSQDGAQNELLGSDRWATVSMYSICPFANPTPLQKFQYTSYDCNKTFL